MNTPTDFITAYQTLQQQAKVQSRPLTESIIALCKTVYDAHANLSPDGFIIFTRRTGLAGHKGRHKRMVTIGKAADVLIPFAASIPATESALFSLSKFDKDGLTSLVRAGSVTPFTSSDDIRILASLHASKSPRGRKELTEVDETPDEAPVAQDLSVNIAAIGILPEGFRYPSVMAFLRELDQFVKQAATRYDCVDPKLRLSPALSAVLKAKAPQAA